jgi:hypothetical protein
MAKYAIFLVMVALLAVVDAPARAVAEEGTADQKLRQAFPGSEVSAAAIKLEVRSQGLLIAASALAVEADGRVKVSDCAIARFPTGETAGARVRPTTIRSEHAYFKLDGAIRSVADLATCKILSVELAGGESVRLASEVPEPKTLLTERGKLLLADDLDQPLGKDWKPNRGAWAVADGALRGAESKEDKHAAVLRRLRKGHDCVYQFSFKFDGAARIGLNVDDPKGHCCLVALTPEGFNVIRATHAEDKDDKRVHLDASQAPLKPGVWHTLVFEVHGKSVLASVDGSAVAFGDHAAIDVDKASFAISVSGVSATFKNLRIWEATPNKDWEITRTKLRADRAK